MIANVWLPSKVFADSSGASDFARRNRRGVDQRVLIDVLRRETPRYRFNEDSPVSRAIIQVDGQMNRVLS